MADHGKGQRVKGHHLPSSSRRAAEYLSKRGEAQIVLASRNPFDIFDDNKNDTFEDSPELTAILTKLCKKDATTKIKAVQELQRYFSATEVEERRRLLKLLVKFI